VCLIFLKYLVQALLKKALSHTNMGCNFIRRFLNTTNWLLVAHEKKWFEGFFFHYFLDGISFINVLAILGINTIL